MERQERGRGPQLMTQSPWPGFRISDNYMGLAPARGTQKPGMPCSVESRPLGDDRGGHLDNPR